MIIDDAESLINDLYSRIKKLEEDLAIAEQNVKDFERLALVWQKSYRDMEKSYKAKLGNAEASIEQLESDLSEFRERQREP